MSDLETEPVAELEAEPAAEALPEHDRAPWMVRGMSRAVSADIGRAAKRRDHTVAQYLTALHEAHMRAERTAGLPAGEVIGPSGRALAVVGQSMEIADLAGLVAAAQAIPQIPRDLRGDMKRYIRAKLEVFR